MKKILFAFLLCTAFTIQSNAQSNTGSATQTKEQSLRESALKDLSDIMKVIDITPEFKNDLMTLLVMRNEAVANAPEANRAELYAQYGKKLMGGLTDAQRDTLKQKTDLFIRLTEYKP
ncbi:hypothetical protein [Flavobacterium sp.]|jgi:hypothetical protein|uniref:hypothetical protein n=1 Tax=Flavobacterium sp. TaxID=239 RepID=UPI002FD9FA3E